MDKNDLFDPSPRELISPMVYEMLISSGIKPPKTVTQQIQNDMGLKNMKSIMDEYEKIQNKKSKLSRAHRDIVVKFVESQRNNK